MNHDLSWLATIAQALSETMPMTKASRPSSRQLDLYVTRAAVDELGEHGGQDQLGLGPR